MSLDRSLLKQYLTGVLYLFTAKHSLEPVSRLATFQVDVNTI